MRKRMAGGISLENVRETDIEEILRLQQQCNLGHWSAESYTEILQRTEYFCKSAKSEGKFAGFINARLIKSEESAELLNIAAAAEFRGRGVGKTLLGNFLNYCKLKGIEAVFLEVRENNARAVAFYQRHGFAHFGMRKNFYHNPSENALLMRLDVKKLGRKKT